MGCGRITVIRTYNKGFWFMKKVLDCKFLTRSIRNPSKLFIETINSFLEKNYDKKFIYFFGKICKNIKF